MAKETTGLTISVTKEERARIRLLKVIEDREYRPLIMRLVDDALAEVEMLNPAKYKAAVAKIKEDGK